MSMLPQHMVERDDCMSPPSLARPHVRPDDLGLGALFRVTHDAVIVVDLATSRVVLLNGAAERLLGYTSQQAARLPLERLVPFADRLGVYALVHGLVQRPSGMGAELRILGAGAQERWIELTAHVVEQAESFALLVCRDVTERKLAEERRHEQARVDGMLRIVEPPGRALDQELAVPQSDLQRVMADPQMPGSVRILVERGRRCVAPALGLVNQLRRVGQVEDTELIPGPEEMLARVTLRPAANYADDEDGKQVFGQQIHV